MIFKQLKTKWTLFAHVALLYFSLLRVYNLTDCFKAVKSVIVELIGRDILYSNNVKVKFNYYVKI